MTGTSPREVTVWLARAIVYLTYAYVVVVQIILVQGFLLLLFGANTGSSYVDWAYRSLERVMAPFRGIFEAIELNGDAVLDTSVIFAMVMYGIVAILVRSLLDWLSYRLARLERDRALHEAGAQAQASDAFAAGYGSAGYAAPNQAPAHSATPGTEPLAPPPSDLHP